jgi:hypothetical protein
MHWLERLNMSRTARGRLIAAFCFAVGCVGAAQAAENTPFYNTCYKGQMAVLAGLSKKMGYSQDLKTNRSIANPYCACLEQAAPVRDYTWDDVVVFADVHPELVNRCLSAAGRSGAVEGLAAGNGE